MMSSHGFRTSLSSQRWMFGMLALVVVFILLEVSWTNLEYVKSGLNHVAHVSSSVSSARDTSPHNWTCLDRMAPNFDRVEDIFCIKLPKFLPNLKNPCFYDYGYNSTQLRCLPYFYIIGMDKCGSTDLHSRVAQHPLVMGNRGSLGKETAFWSWLRYGIYNKRVGYKKVYLEQYLDMFTEAAHLIEETNMTQIVTGDATPMDLWDFRSWTTIPQNYGLKEPAVLTPHFLRYIHQGQTPKFIIQFREPVERLYSDYIFLNYGTNPKQFHNHCMEAIDMMNSCTGNFTQRICYFSDELYHALPVRIHLGCYSVFLKEWFNVFPRSAFLITRTDEYKNDMPGTLAKVFKFLDLPSLPEFKMKEILNQTRRHVTKQKEGSILPETIEILRNFYDGCNKETAGLLNDSRFLWLDHYS